MLKQILTYLPELSLEEMAALQGNVVAAIKGVHKQRRHKAAARFQSGGDALYCGKRIKIQLVQDRHVVTDSGEVVPISQCRPLNISKSELI